MSLQIGPFYVRQPTIRRELAAGLRKSLGFTFPHQKFAGVDLQGRLAAVASDYFHVTPKQVMLISGKIEGEGPRTEFAVLTGNPEGITSSRLAFLVLADFEGQANVVVKVEEIRGVQAVARKPLTAGIPAPREPGDAFGVEPAFRGRKPRREREARSESDYKFIIWICRNLIDGHSERHWNYNELTEKRPELLARFKRGGVSVTEAETALGEIFHWPAADNLAPVRPAQAQKPPRAGGQKAEICAMVTRYKTTLTIARGLVMQYPDLKSRDQAMTRRFGWSPAGQK